MEGNESFPFLFGQNSSEKLKQIEESLNQLFSEGELDDCFLVELKVAPSGSKIEVFIDSDSGLSIDKCRKVSRHLESLIEEQQLMPEKYYLDVSSPGIGRPLTIARQYIKNIGRKIVIKRTEGKEVKGKLIEADDSKVKVAIPLSRKEAKELGVKFKEIELEYSEITNAKIQISF